jgi:prepilin-type N-terminal cleavage/methylation domain-containing protein
MHNLGTKCFPCSSLKGFTLAEVVVSLMIVATTFCGITLAYMQSARRAEYSGRSLAAQSMNIQLIEQARAAQWDFIRPIDQIVAMNLMNYQNSGGVLSGYTWTNLDLPSSGTNFVRATNYLTIRMITNSGGSIIRMIHVDTVWPFDWKSRVRYITNTTCTYRAPDQ